MIDGSWKTSYFKTSPFPFDFFEPLRHEDTKGHKVERLFFLLTNGDAEALFGMTGPIGFVY